MKRQVFSYAELTFDQVSKQLVVKLSYAKGSVKVAAKLDIDSVRLSKWQQNQQDGRVAPTGKTSIAAE